MRTAHLTGVAALSAAELSLAEVGVSYVLVLKRTEENGLRVYDPVGEQLLAQYSGPRFWQERATGPGAAYVTNPVENGDTFTLNIAGLTPAIVGTGLPFDIELTAVQPRNPVKFSGEVIGQVNIDVGALTGDAQGTMEIIPAAEVSVSGLTPEALGAGLAWDATRKIVGYKSSEDLAVDAARFVEAAWPSEPGATPLIAVGSPDAPEVGTVNALAAAALPSRCALFDVLLKVGLAGYESDAAREAEVGALGSSVQKYVDLPAPLALGDAATLTLESFVAPAGVLDVDVIVSPHPTGYHFDYAPPNRPDPASWDAAQAVCRFDLGPDNMSGARVSGYLTYDTRVVFKVLPPALNGVSPIELAHRAQDDIKRLMYDLNPALQDAGMLRASEPVCPPPSPRMVRGRPVEVTVEYTLTWRQRRYNPSPLV